MAGCVAEAADGGVHVNAITPHDHLSGTSASAQQKLQANSSAHLFRKVRIRMI